MVNGRVEINTTEKTVNLKLQCKLGTFTSLRDYGANVGFQHAYPGSDNASSF